MKSSRADAVRRVSMLMTNPKFHRDMAEHNVVNEDGEIPMIVTGSDESAVVAMHRMERVKASKIVLATAFDHHVHVVYVTVGEDSDPEPHLVDLVGGMTVRDWFEMMRLNPGCTYHASGSDIMSAASASEYAVA